MELIDNINRLLGDDLKRALKPGARLKVAAQGYEGIKPVGVNADFKLTRSS